MTPFVIISSDLKKTGGMDRANYAYWRCIWRCRGASGDGGEPSCGSGSCSRRESDTSG